MPTQTEMKMQPHSPISMLAVHGFFVRRRPTRSLIARFVSHVREASRCQRDYQRLRAMSDHELNDLGLNRSQIIAAHDALPWPFSRSFFG